MSEKQYASLAGFIAFDPETKDNVNGQTILNFSVRAIGFTGQPLVQVTLWGQWAEYFDAFEKGDFVAIDGGYRQNISNGNVYHNVSAGKVFHNGTLLVPADREDAPAAPSRGDTTPAF